MKDYECRTDSPNWHYDTSQDLPVIPIEEDNEPTQEDYENWLDKLDNLDALEAFNESGDPNDVRIWIKSLETCDDYNADLHLIEIKKSLHGYLRAQFRSDWSANHE